jgi:hypothetical protein
MNEQLLAVRADAALQDGQHGDTAVLPHAQESGATDAVRATTVLRYLAPECCGRAMYLTNSKRGGEYRRFWCKACGKRVSIGAKRRGRPKKEVAPKI